MKVSTGIGIGAALTGLAIGIGVAIKKHQENEFESIVNDDDDIAEDEADDNIADENDDDSKSYETHTVSGRNLDFCKGIIEERHGKDYEILNVNENATDKNSAFPDEKFTTVVYRVLKCV